MQSQSLDFRQTGKASAELKRLDSLSAIFFLAVALVALKDRPNDSSRNLVLISVIDLV